MQMSHAGMPSAAEMPMLLERPHNNGVELTWRTQSSNGSGPILYLVSSRSNVGRHFSDVDMTSWQVLTKVSNSVYSRFARHNQVCKREQYAIVTR